MVWQLEIILYTGMLPPLKAFLDECKSKNIPLDQVVSGLKNAGWSAEQIERASQYYVLDVALAGTPPKKSSLPVITSIILLFFILFSGLGVSAYFVAIEKIPISNSSLKETISSLVFSLPFVPKTPRYLLGAAISAHKKLSRNSFDLSLATSSNDFQSVLGTNQLDLRIAGYTDFSDAKNPKFTLDLDWSKQLSAHALKSDKLIYLKVDKLPLFVNAYLGMDPARMALILMNWVVYDPTPLETEARKNIRSQSGINSPINQTTVDLVNKMLDEDILPLIKVSSDQVGSDSAYKLTYQPTDTQLDRVYTKFSQGLGSISTLPKSDIFLKSVSVEPSQYIKNFVASIWIDQKKFYIRKLIVSFTYHPDRAVSAVPVSDASIAIALKLSDFGKNIPIIVPSAALSPDEFYTLIQKYSPKLIEQENSLKTTQLTSDLYALHASVLQYSLDHKGVFPSNLSVLVPKYLASLPNSVAEYKLVYKFDKSKTRFIIYSSIPDPINHDKPFKGIDSGSYVVVSYSQKDITAF